MTRDWEAETRRHTIPDDLGEMLSSERRRLGLTQFEAAWRIAISETFIGYLEHAKRAPSAVVAEQIIKVYALRPDQAEWLRGAACEGVGKDRPGRVEHEDFEPRFPDPWLAEDQSSFH